MAFESISDNVQWFALNLTSLLLISMSALFALICRKHWQRVRREHALTEINHLLDHMTDIHLFHEPNHSFHEQLHQVFHYDNLDLMYAFVHKAQGLTGKTRESFFKNAARCGLFDCIPENLKSARANQVCIALEVCGLAQLDQYIQTVEAYTWKPVYAPFACHALVRMNFREGMETLFRAYGHRLINNTELLIICSEVGPDELKTWAIESRHVPLPEVLITYGLTS